MPSVPSPTGWTCWTELVLITYVFYVAWLGPLSLENIFFLPGWYKTLLLMRKVLIVDVKWLCHKYA